MINKKYTAISFLLALLTIPVLAQGKGHENCNLCHLAVEDGNYNLTVKPNYQTHNPNTGQPFVEEDAVCMRCHKMEAKSIHPVGIIPDLQKVTMPSEITSKEGKLICASCHDIHESKNFRYLRWPVDSENAISQFCIARCHAKYAKPLYDSARLVPYLVQHRGE
ncbi:MAG: hypothetical protein HZA78_08560 [Candidatus Schekmanbacteria bacterium]|nr:hypothetical protein [Candidatus Schekmanbacteria bacterium]